MDRMKKRETIERYWLAIAVLALLFFVTTAVAVAQTDAPVTGEREVTPDEVNVVARELWCPLCSGVRLDTCELKACDQMKDMIAIKLAEGEDAESIEAYFLEQYGPQVLGEPPRSGFNWLAWILPAVAVVIGGLFFWRTTRRMVQPAPVTAETTAVRTVTTPNEDDEYAQKLEEELAKYG